MKTTPHPYWDIMARFPHLKGCYTVKTSKGFHIYTKYNPRYKTTTNKEALIDVRSARIAFKEIADEYDVFMNELEERYYITRADEDKVAKADVEGYFECKHMKWNKVLSELKRVGIKYVRDHSINGSRGVVYGLKEKDLDDD